MDKLPDVAYSTIPWGWYRGQVGRWELEIPLSRETVDVFGHGSLLDVLDDLFDIAGDFFYPAQVECPSRHGLFDYTVMLPRVAVREALDQRWSALAYRDRNYSPACEICGISCIYVISRGVPTRAAVPNAIRIGIEGDLERRNPVAKLTVATKCDVWLDRTIGGEPNGGIGALNREILAGKLKELEAGLGGRIAAFATDFGEVDVEQYGMKNRDADTSSFLDKTPDR